MGLFTKSKPLTPGNPAPAAPASSPPASGQQAKPAAKPAAAVAGNGGGKVEVNVPKLSIPAAPAKKPPAQLDERAARFQELKTSIHRKLVEQLDMTKLGSGVSEDTKAQVRQVIEALCDEEDTLLNYQEKKRLSEEILHETFGLGPLEELLKDHTISDILINGPKQVYIERRGRLELTDIKFKDNAHLLHIIDKIVAPLGRRCDEVSPMVDARLKDGSRVNAIIPPLAIDGPSLSIRRFGNDPITWDDYVRFKSCAPEMVHFLEACVHAGLNVLVAGGTGSGKTTLLNNLSTFIPEDERIVTIEDAAELRLRQPHVVRLETRPANIEGKGRIAIRDLLINSLRMRPDRIVVGECRGGETLDMLQAMNTGHEGSMTTIHANNTRDAVQRVETMVMMSGFDLPARAIRQQFASAVHLIVQASRLTGGPRKITNITEVQGMEGDVVTMQDLFKFEQLGVSHSGKAYGNLMATGVRPGFLERLKAHGADIDADWFTPRVLVQDSGD